MSLFHTTPPLHFLPMPYPGSPGPYIDFHFAIIKEFNKPKRKRVITWFVLNYNGDFSYAFHGRRITSVHKNYNKPYFQTQRFFSGA